MFMPRTELVELSGQEGLVEMFGGSVESCIAISDSVLAFTCGDDLGSIGQYLIRTGSSGCEESIEELDNVLSGNFSDKKSLHSQFHAYLKIFTDGMYRITLYDSKNCYLIQPSYDDSTYFLGDFYNIKPGDVEEVYPGPSQVWVYTLARDLIQENRVEMYVHSISKGKRPIVLMASVENGWFEFVLDGHHKLLAYSQAGICPRILSVCRISPPLVPKDQFVKSFGASHPMADWYNQRKERNDRLAEISDKPGKRQRKERKRPEQRRRERQQRKK
jgi:hypothetical protein